jgi:predicted O-methyltransferase YrrM
MGIKYTLYQYIRGIYLRTERIVIERKLKSMGIGHAHQISTHATQIELHELYRLAQNCPSNPKVLEIGSYLGASTCYIGAAVAQKNGVVYCVDTWMNQTMPEGLRDTYNDFRTNTDPLSHCIIPVRKASRMLSIEDISAPLDLVFIDGDHSYLQVKEDFQLVSAWLSPAGLIAFHDYRYFPGVSRVVGEAIATGCWQLDGLASNLCWIRKAPETWRDR